MLKNVLSWRDEERHEGEKKKRRKVKDESCIGY